MIPLIARESTAIIIPNLNLNPNVVVPWLNLIFLLSLYEKLFILKNNLLSSSVPSIIFEFILFFSILIHPIRDYRYKRYKIDIIWKKKKVQG